MKQWIWGFFCALFLAGPAVCAGGRADAGLSAALDAGNTYGWHTNYTDSASVPVDAGNTVQASARIESSLKDTNGTPEPADKKAELTLYAASAVLMDADSGRVLYGKNENEPMAMASTTKILTCIVVLEHASLDETVTVSSYAAGMPKVKLYLKKGEEYSVRDLLYSLMLESHNDSAVALAEHVGRKVMSDTTSERRAGTAAEGKMSGNAPEKVWEKTAAEETAAEDTPEESRRAVAAFARLMNEKAVEIGCKDSWFITPNGLDAAQEFTFPDGGGIRKEHCTTAAELARILAYCIKQSPERERFLEITRTENYTFSANGRSFSCVNHNAFLHMMDGALCGKTGFTNKAGYCYVGALERDGRTFVVAVLACGWPNNRSYKWSDTKKLMQYGIENYQYRSFSEEGTAFDESLLAPVPVRNGQTASLGEEAFVEIVIEKAEQEAKVRNIPDSAEARRSSADGLLMREDERIEVRYEWEKSLNAPVQRGVEIGEITYSVDGTVYKTEKIVTAGEVAEVDLKWCFEKVWERFRPGIY